MAPAHGGFIADSEESHLFFYNGTLALSVPALIFLGELGSGAFRLKLTPA